MNKFLDVYQKSHVTAQWDSITGLILLHSVWNVVLVILKSLSQSVSTKWFGMITFQNCLSQLHFQTAGIRLRMHDGMTVFIAFCLRALSRK